MGGAFYGTDLDLHLHRRNIKTIILGGIATNFGVDSTGLKLGSMGMKSLLLRVSQPAYPENYTICLFNQFFHVLRVWLKVRI